jgi:hypothetical protein
LALLFGLRRRSLCTGCASAHAPGGIALRLDLLALLPLKPALGGALLKVLLRYGLARLMAVILIESPAVARRREDSCCEYCRW